MHSENTKIIQDFLKNQSRHSYSKMILLGCTAILMQSVHVIFVLMLLLRLVNIILIYRIQADLLDIILIIVSAIATWYFYYNKFPKILARLLKY